MANLPLRATWISNLSASKGNQTHILKNNVKNRPKSGSNYLYKNLNHLYFSNSLEQSNEALGE